MKFTNLDPVKRTIVQKVDLNSIQDCIKWRTVWTVSLFRRPPSVLDSYCAIYTDPLDSADCLFNVMPHFANKTLHIPNILNMHAYMHASYAEQCNKSSSEIDLQICGNFPQTFFRSGCLKHLPIMAKY